MLQYAHLWNGAGEKECVANYNETDVSFPFPNCKCNEYEFRLPQKNIATHLSPVYEMNATALLVRVVA